MIASGLPRRFVSGFVLTALTLTATPAVVAAQERVSTRTATGPVTYSITTGGTMTPLGRSISIKNTGDTLVVNPRLIANDKRWGSAEEIVAGVIRPGMTDDQKARALWSFARDNRYHWWPPTMGLDDRDAVKLFNVYGYGQCSDVSDALAALFVAAGLPARQWVIGNWEHSVAEAFYDGSWHMLDPDRDGLYLAADNRTLAGVEDLIANPSLVARGGPAHQDLISLYANTNPALWYTEFTRASHRLNVTLRPEEELSLSWTGSGSYQDDTGWGGPPPPIYGNGLLTTPYSPSRPGARSLLTRAVNLRLNAEDGQSPGASPATVNANGDLILRVRSPYVIVGATLDGDFTRGDANDLLEVSTARNGGSLVKSWSDLAYAAFTTDGFPHDTAGMSTWSQDGSYPALHPAETNAPGHLTYRMRPLPDAAGRIMVGGAFFRYSPADDLRILISPDGQTWQTVWTATSELGRFTTSVNIGPIASAWNLIHVRYQLTSGEWFWGAGLEGITIENVDPLSYRLAWSAATTGSTGSFSRAIDLTPTTAWFGSVPLYEYLVRIRMRSGVSPLSVGVNTFTIRTTVQLAPGALPALRLGANSLSYTDESSGAHQVTITQRWYERTDGRIPSAPPTPVYPANNAHIAAGEQVPFVWQAASNPGAPIYRYQLWLCDSPACTSPLTSATEFFVHNTDVGPDGVFGTGDDGSPRTPLPMLSASIGSSLTPGRYYWRVRAQDPSVEFGPWSAVWSFVVDQTGVPSSAAPQVTIAAPTSEATFVTANATLALSGTATSPAGVTSVRWFTDTGASGVATGLGSWSAAAVPLATGGDTLVTVVVTDAQGRVGMDTLAVTRGAALTQYILPEGATGDFFDLDVVVANPNDTAASATARFLVEGASEVTLPLTVQPYSRQRIRVDEVPGVGGVSVSTVIASTSGVPLVVERTSSWDATGYGAHGARALGAPSVRWLFAEGSQGWFDTYILLANAGGSSANAVLSFYLEGGGLVERTYVVPPASRVTVYTGTIAELVNHSFAFEVNANVPITAERATYFGTARMWDGGHSSTGATAPATRWFHAEGATGPFFDTLLLIGNPNASTAHITVTYLTSGGVTVVRQHDVAPRGRLTVNIEDQDPALANEAVASIVDSDVPIVSERVTYWGGWTEGSISLGETAPALRWGVADARLGGPREYQTYVLIANPDATRDADITVRYFTAAGVEAVKRYLIPAGRRWNLSVGAEVPALDGQELSLRIDSTNNVPVFVARAMYWNSGGAVWAAGVSVPGTPLP